MTVGCACSNYGHDNIYGVGCKDELTIRIMNQEFIINDMDGNPIHEGDRVWGYAQEYASTLVEDGPVPVYEEDHDKPKPVRDVPLFKGQTYWSEEMLAWYVKLSWICDAWKDGAEPCALAMGGGSYAYQKEA